MGTRSIRHRDAFQLCTCVTVFATVSVVTPASQGRFSPALAWLEPFPDDTASRKQKPFFCLTNILSWRIQAPPACFYTCSCIAHQSFTLVSYLLFCASFNLPSRVRLFKSGFLDFFHLTKSKKNQHLALSKKKSEVRFSICWLLCTFFPSSRNKIPAIN